MQYVIEATGLTRRFKDVEAVAGVDFSVGRGELYGFLGPNGAGKTTIINILCTLLKATSGRAKVAGFDVSQEPSEVRRHIGLVFQDPSLDDYLTAKENLEFHAMCYRVPSREARRRIEEMMRMVGLWDRKDSLVRTFSGGMKRRLELARGLVHQPEALFLDEPTIGLDPQSRRSIWSHVKELRQRSELTIFMTTHYLEEAEQCDRVAIIDHGSIAALGSPAAIKNSLGGEVITLRAIDNNATSTIIRQRYALDVQCHEDRLEFQVKNGSQFIPELMRELGDQVVSVELRRPTLEDAFIQLTGHAIRDQEAEEREQLMARSRSRGAGRI